MNQGELIRRGDLLAQKYSENALKEALKNALVIDDNEERLALQWALKQKTKTSDGYAFTKELQAGLKVKLSI